METEVPFTSARHLSLSWATSIQSIPPHTTPWRFILILSSHLRRCFPSGLFPSGFPTKALYTPILSPLPPTCFDFLSFVNCNEETIPRTQLVGVFIINLSTKFQTRISSALFVNIIKATKMFYYWPKIMCIRHTDVDLEKKFTDGQHRRNVHTNVLENRLLNPN